MLGGQSKPPFWCHFAVKNKIIFRLPKTVNETLMPTAHSGQENCNLIATAVTCRYPDRAEEVQCVFY